MGLNTQMYKLWKDRAMLELNVAILHSFQVIGGFCETLEFGNHAAFDKFQIVSSIKIL